RIMTRCRLVRTNRAHSSVLDYFLLADNAEVSGGKAFFGNSPEASVCISTLHYLPPEKRKLNVALETTEIQSQTEAVQWHNRHRIGSSQKALCVAQHLAKPLPRSFYINKRSPTAGLLSGTSDCTLIERTRVLTTSKMALPLAKITVQSVEKRERES